MGYSRFVGRVGTLAVALGIGVAVASPGIALADDDETAGDPGTESSQQAEIVDNTEERDDAQESALDDADDPVEGDEEPVDDEVPEEDVAPSEPAPDPEPVFAPEPSDEGVDAENDDLTVDFVDEPDADEPPAEVAVEVTETELLSEESADPLGTLDAPSLTDDQDTVVVGVYTVESGAPIDIALRVGTLDETPAALTQQLAPAPAPPSPLRQLLTIPARLLSAAINLTVAVLEPYIGPGAPFDNALLWGVLAWVRRESNLVLDNQSPGIGVDSISLDVEQNGAQTITTLPEFDADGERLTYAVAPRGEAGGPQAGFVTIVGNVVTYIPDTDFVGDDSFVLTASDEGAGNHLHQVGGHTDTVIVSVTVSEVVVNEPPTIGSLTGPSDPAADGTVTGSFVVTDENLQDVTVEVISGGEPEHGTVTVDFDETTGVLTYTYRPTLATRLQGGQGATFGPDSFVVAVSDGVNAAVEQSVAGVEVGGAATLEVGDSAALAGDNNEHFVISDDGKRAYVLNYDDNQTISVVDIDPASATYTDVLETIPLNVTGEQPINFADRIEKTPDGTRAYITVTHVDGAGVESSDIHVLDLTTHTVVDTIDTGLYGDEMFFHPDGGLLYFVDYGASGTDLDGRLRVLNTDPMSPDYHSFVGDPVSIFGVDQLVLSDDGTRLFALSITPAADFAYLVEYVADPTSEYWGASISDPLITTSDAYSLALSPDGNRAYFTNRDGDVITAVNIDRLSPDYETTEQVPVGDAPDLLRVSADGSVVYVLNTYFDDSETTLTVIDAATGDVIVDELPLGSSAWALRVNPDGSGWFSTDEIVNGPQAPGLTELRLVPVP